MKRISLLIFILLVLVGCTEDEKPDDEQMDVGSTLEESCKIDTEKIQKLLEEVVTGEIDCLKTNLEQFSDFVRREDPRYIKIEELAKFINRFFPDDAVDINKNLNFLFDLNSLFLKDPRKKLSVSKIDSLFEIIKIVNRNGVPLNKIFKRIIDEDDPVNYWDFRYQIKFILNDIFQQISDVVMAQSGPNISLGIIDFLGEFKKAMDVSDEDLDLDVVKKYLFIKKILAGGDPLTITTVQIVDLIPRMRDLATLGLDLLYAADLELKTDKEKDLFYFEQIGLIKSSMHKWGEDEVLFDLNDLVNVAKELLKDSDFEVDKPSVRDSLVNIKENFVQGYGDTYTYGDVLAILDIVKEMLGMFVYTDHAWEHFEDFLKGNNKVPDNWDRPDIPGLNGILDNVGQLTHWKEFYTIIKDYRLFHAPDGFQYYTGRYKRYLNGLKLTYMLRFGLTKAINHYGYEDRDADGNFIEMYAKEDSIIRLLNDIKGVMQEIGLFPDYGVPRFASEAMTSSDLFQWQSNGDGKIQMREVTEYVGTIISSANFTADMLDVMKTHCEEIEEDAFDVRCFREWFFHSLFEELNYKRYYAKLYDYTALYPADEVRGFLEDVEVFGRVKPDDDIPMDKIDIGRLFTAMSNIESVLVRYDVNDNNILDRDEIEVGWGTFRNTILTFGNLKPSQEKLGKSIYLFILKKMKAPTTIEALWFHLFGNKKKVTARRMNLGAIFRLVAEATIPSS